MGERPQLQSTLNRSLEVGYSDFKTIDEVFAFVYNTPYVSDMDNYGVSDFWAPINLFIQRGGDCEDYAIAAATILINSNIVNRNEIKFMLVSIPGYGDHMILIIKDKIVFDNLHKQPMKVTSREFRNYEVIGVIK